MDSPRKALRVAKPVPGPPRRSDEWDLAANRAYESGAAQAHTRAFGRVANILDFHPSGG
jgi:hypothetical protein